LFISRQGYTRKSLIDFVNQTTDRNKEKKAGIVLNDVNPKNYGGYSYRYGGYYKKAYYGSNDGYFDEGIKKANKSRRILKQKIENQGV
jgi:hypothetical protein